MIRLLRHDQSVPREDDGAVRFDDILEEFKEKKFDGALQWPIGDWISILAKGGGPKKRFQYCLNLTPPDTSCSDGNIELLLRMVISANQLSVFGAIGDLCNELSEDPGASETPEAPDHVETMEIQTGPSDAETQTNAQQRWNLVCKNTRENSNTCQKTRNYPHNVLMMGLKLVESGQHFYTLETEEGQQMQHTRCLEMRRRLIVRGWIRKNTRIGPVLNTKVCHHEEQYTIEVLVKSLFQDRTASWARIVNGVDKYVTESLLTKEEEDIAPEKPIAKARPRQKPRVALTSVSIPVFERNWVDIETQRSHGQQCFEVSKPLSDCYDMIKQSFAEVTEQSSTMTSSKSAGRRSSMVLRDGHVS